MAVTVPEDYIRRLVDWHTRRRLEWLAILLVLYVLVVLWSWYLVRPVVYPAWLHWDVQLIACVQLSVMWFHMFYLEWWR